MGVLKSFLKYSNSDRKIYRKLKAIKDSYKGAEFDVFSLFQPDQTLLGDPC